MAEAESNFRMNTPGNANPMTSELNPTSGQPVPVSESEAPLPWKLMLFVAFQVLLLAGGGAWAGYRLHQQRQERLLPRFQNEPLRVRPTYDHPEMISDEELTSVLTRLAPKFREDKVGLNAVDHALRFWGLEARFADPACFSGAEMRDMLLDQRRFSTVWGEKTPEFLTLSRIGGVRARVAEGEASASHVDHTLATMAEIGTPLDYPIVTSRGNSQLRMLLLQAMRDFSLNQVEYEWSTLVFALYHPTPAAWFTSENQRIDFNVLARRIMRQDLPQGVCYGNHRLYTLAALLRLDEQQPLLDATTRTEVLAFLKDMTARLIKNQKAEGYWDGTWSGKKDGDVVGPGQTVLGNRILATGHALEWWAIAPQELHPPQEVLNKAAKWLIKTIQPMSHREVLANYTFLSHAGRSLALWRGKFPAEVALKFEAAPADKKEEAEKKEPAETKDSAEKKDPSAKKDEKK